MADDPRILIIAAGIMSHIQTSPGHIVTITPDEVSRAKDWPHNCHAGDDDGAESDVGDVRQVCMTCSAREAIGAARRVLEALDAHEKTAGG